MRTFETRWRFTAAMIASTAMAAACGNSGGGGNDAGGTTADASTFDAGRRDSGAPGTDAGNAVDTGTPAVDAGEVAIVIDAGTDAGLVSNPLDAGNVTQTDAGALDGGNPYPALPAVLSATGCTANTVGPVGPICSVTQTGATLRANCNGLILDGSITTAGAVTLTAADRPAIGGGNITLSCTGNFTAPSGTTTRRLSATCTQTSLGDGGANTRTCNLVSDPFIAPDVACLELPSSLSSVVFTPASTQDAAPGGAPVNAGNCSVIQDGCNFQAQCASDITFAGAVSRTGMTFTRAFPATAESRNNQGTVVFAAGQSVNHSCTGTLTGGTTLGGTCGAGGTSTNRHSLYTIGGAATTPVPVCAPLASTNEVVFALDSCALLRDPSNEGPGIGQPVCVWRQNNCIWNVQCTGDDLAFGGRLVPGATRATWRLQTGTPCEIGFNGTSTLSGMCTVPGQQACALGSIASPVRGGATCPTLPAGTDFYTRGCGGGDPLNCRQMVQHGCNFVATCSFTAGFPDLVVRGEASYGANQRAHLDFNGLSDFECFVDQATTTEISTGDRRANEWYGNCANATTPMCRNNYNPDAGTGFRGLQLYFGRPLPDGGI